MYKPLAGLGLLTLGLLLSAGMPMRAQDPSVQPDNTKVNKRDRHSGEPTADQQKENSTDRDLTRKIRRALLADKALSTYAKNIKIISQNGTVTLKGPVHNQEERNAIVAKAEEIAGSAKVTDNLSVKGDKGKS